MLAGGSELRESDGANGVASALASMRLSGAGRADWNRAFEGSRAVSARGSLEAGPFQPSRSRDPASSVASAAAEMIPRTSRRFDMGVAGEEFLVSDPSCCRTPLLTTTRAPLRRRGLL